MANTYTLLETVTVGSAGASSIVFNSIPQTGYTDLAIKVSSRSSISSTLANIKITFNGSGGVYTRKELYAENGAIGTEQVSDNIVGDTSGNTATANTFGSAEIYIPNYTSSNTKCFSVDSVSENNITNSGMWMLGGLWSLTNAITSITIAPNTTTWMQYSTFSLYGVSALGVTPTIAPKAAGGSIIQTDGTYWYHAFLSSGTFTPATALSCDVLVVAGGGGGSGNASNAGAGGGGGGAGGLYYAASQSVGASAQTITVGAGGSGGVGSGASTSGSNSVFASLTATGGGLGAYDRNGASGGSGGGARYDGTIGAGNTPSTSPSQGNNGGLGSALSYNGGGGGGGAGAIGAAGTGTTNPATNVVGGNGGVGINTYSSWLSTTGLGVSGYLAGGGGGSVYAGVGTGGTGGSGGGGAGQVDANGTAGTANTGGGGGASGRTTNTAYNGGAGGSGVVIIRYLVA